ncbi:MAG: UDP-3-O-(3-hydroxymyristoyl)glucosamine N-acyltransferase [Desulfuromonas sp.]|nr:MAG: UDP-3-O-(3-hydroxymyristoyl)glucosamine N-acyltransferase [Desulfuromonas sp.]
MKLNEILAQLGLAPVEPGDLEITGIAGLADATRSQISYACELKHGQELTKTQAPAVFLPEKLKGLVGSGTVAIVVENPELSMAEASRLFRPHFELPQAGTQKIDPTAVIFPNVALGSNVTVGKNCRIMSGAYLGDDVVIGDETVIHPNVVVYHHCRIGSRCAIHANTVIGSDGFGYAHTSSGEHVKIEQMGNVVIEDDVEIGSNTSIDRATFKSTTIRRGSKIDNLVHLSHNVEIGEHSIIAGQTGIAGSTTLGRNVVMAAQSGATGHIKIADFTTVAARGGVTKNTEPGKTYAGFPIMEHGLWLKFQAKLARLVKQKS